MTKLVAAGSAGVLVLVLIIWCFSGLTYATEGERVVALKWGKIQQVIAPDDGWVFLLSPGWDTYKINIKSFTSKATAKVTSKDNAAVQVEVAVTGATDSGQEALKEYVRTFGIDE